MEEIFEFPKTPVALTIGMFDGVHLGHRHLLKRLKQTGSKAAVLTFSNHPYLFFHPEQALLQITTHAQKKRLLQEAGVDLLVTLPFDAKLASMRYFELLECFALTHLILGKGAVFGRNREGTEENVRAWADARGVIVEYLPKLTIGGLPVSSTSIRQALLCNDRLQAELLLGYPLKHLEESNYV